MHWGGKVSEASGMRRPRARGMLASQMPCARNLFADIPAELPEELIEEFLAHDDLRIERIVSRGHCSPPGF